MFCAIAQVIPCTGAAPAKAWVAKPAKQKMIPAPKPARTMDLTNMAISQQSLCLNSPQEVAQPTFNLRRIRVSQSP
jgi:hypothetical protein